MASSPTGRGGITPLFDDAGLRHLGGALAAWGSRRDNRSCHAPKYSDGMTLKRRRLKGLLHEPTRVKELSP